MSPYECPYCRNVEPAPAAGDQIECDNCGGRWTVTAEQRAYVVEVWRLRDATRN